MGTSVVVEVFTSTTDDPGDGIRFEATAGQGEHVINRSPVFGNVGSYWEWHFVPSWVDQSHKTERQVHDANIKFNDKETMILECCYIWARGMNYMTN